MTHMSQIWCPLLCSALLTIMSLKMKTSLKISTSQQMQMMANVLGITIDTEAGLDAIPAFLLIPQCLACCWVTTTSIVSWWEVCISTWKQKQKFQWMFAVDCRISIGSWALLPQSHQQTVLYWITACSYQGISVYTKKGCLLTESTLLLRSHGRNLKKILHSDIWWECVKLTCWIPYINSWGSLFMSANHFMQTFDL